MHRHTHTHTHTHKHTHTHAHAHTHTHMQFYTSTHTHTHTDTDQQSHTHGCAPTLEENDSNVIGPVYPIFLSAQNTSSKSTVPLPRYPLSSG
jgi:hypothetical protein